MKIKNEKAFIKFTDNDEKFYFQSRIKLLLEP